MTRRRLSAFTLIELIVVMAIIVTLSVIGFISYNSYVRDARNATRQSQLEEATAAIDRFIFNNGRAPKCRNATATIPGAAVCYFTPNSGSGVADAAKAKGPTALVAPALGYLPCTVTTAPPNPSCGTPAAAAIFGIDANAASNDWAGLNLKSNPTDPRGPYFVYATDGGTAYALFATKEEASGYSTMVRGYKAMPWDSATAAVDKIQPAMNYATNYSVYGFQTTGGTFTATVGALLGDGNVTAAGGTTGPVPYTW